MKQNLKLIILMLSIIILVMVSNLAIDKYFDESLEVNSPKEEILEKPTIEPIYKIYLPEIKTTCTTDDCITEKMYDDIYQYINDKYQIEEQDNHTFIVKGDEHIELVHSEKVDAGEYRYVIDNNTTITNIQEMIDGKDLSPKIDDPATEIAVLNYHFFYDKRTESCDESICLDIKNFEKQLKYLKDNDYKTLTMEEFRAWMYGEIELPKKSVLITVDDGAMGTGRHNGNKLIPLLEKYEMHATLFLITAWWDKENYVSPYLDIESHSNNLHVDGVCNNKDRGAKLLCSDKEKIKKDLTKSIKKLGNNTAFCFPYYLYDDKSIEVLKELDFKLAFIGGNKKASRQNNEYLIPRYIIYSDTSLNSFIDMIS